MCVCVCVCVRVVMAGYIGLEKVNKWTEITNLVIHDLLIVIFI